MIKRKNKKIKNIDSNRKVNKKNKKNNKKIELSGTISVHSRGFGFLLVDDKSIENFNWDKGDVFIKRSLIKGAMDGDKVIVKLSDSRLWRNSAEGEVVRILERNHISLVGKMERNKKFGFVVPINKKIQEDVFVKGANLGCAKDGDIVKVELLSYKTKDASPEGKVVDIVARASETGGDIKAKIVENGLSLEFSKNLLRHCEKIQEEKLTKHESKRRRNLKNKIIFTIDGEDSKDFDDGVSIEVKADGNFVLGVHIADVSFYVKEDDPIDIEARKRANSVYLINQVVPMLPEKLSSYLCSLVPYEDRLAFTCEMTFDKNGKILSYDLYESIINSKARLTYKEVNQFFTKENNDNENITKDIEISLKNMKLLASKLIENRNKRGAIDFDTKEPKIILDKKGKAVEILLEDRGMSERIIEEFMLKANECVARHVSWMKLPFIYRNHLQPTLEKLGELRKFLAGMGINIKGDINDIKPFHIKNLIDECKGKPVSDLVQRAMLKSMEKADYSSRLRGHFGLALDTYTHFTSPIRRYSDLVVHRVLKDIILGNINPFANEDELEKIAVHCSKVERDTTNLERDVEKMKLTEYLEKHIGDRYKGIVSGITQYGIFVEIMGCIDGRVSIDDLGNEIFVAQEERYRVVGITSGKTYILGDEIDIIVDDVDADKGEIDFVLA